MDDTYQVYVNRLARMTQAESYNGQLQTIQESTKFQQQEDGQWQAAPFPGYSVITTPWEDSADSKNDAFYTRLKACQETLLQQLPANLLIPVPPSSFHLTLADLIWDDAYRHAEQDPDFEVQLCDRVASSFRQAQSSFQAQTAVGWQPLGLIVMPRALGIALVPENESAYDRTVLLRRAIYQNPDLIALGIEQQYHFTGHITLGYFGNIEAAKAAIAGDWIHSISDLLANLNQFWLDPENTPTLQVDRAELRKFDTMTRYYRDSAWPILDL